MLEKTIYFLAILLIGEIIAVLIFRKLLNPPFGIPQTPAAIWEGLMERVFLFLSFVNGIYLALVFFGALKIATHINPNDNSSEQTIVLPKNYYLMGNILSATLAVIYLMFWRLFTGS